MSNKSVRPTIYMAKIANRRHNIPFEGTKIKSYFNHNSIYIALFLAVLLRIAYWLEVSDQAWFIAPGTDSEFYINWAKDIVSGNAGEYFPFPRAPLFPYLLALAFKLFGDSLFTIRLMNLALDSFTLILIYRIAQQLFKSKNAALTAALLYAFSGGAIYFTGEILMTSLSIFLFTAVIYCILTIGKTNSAQKALFSGFLTSAFALCRPNALVLIPLSIIFILAKTPHKSKKIVNSLLHIATILLIISPVIWINYQSTSKLTPVSLQGGVNFYIGNHQNASGWASSLPGAGAAWSETEARLIAEKHAGRKLDPVETSRTYFKMGIDEILADPFSWIELTVKKTWLLINIREIGNNRPLFLAQRDSVIFRFTRFLSAGFLFPFMITGLIFYFNNPKVKILLSYMALYSLSIIIFFITARYRIPLLPATVVFAAVGIRELSKKIKQKSDFRLPAIIVISGFILTVPNWFKDSFEQKAQALFVEGNALMRLDRHGEAIHKYQSALENQPGFPQVYLNIGVAYLSTGDTLKAESAFQKQIEYDPQNYKALNNLGAIHERKGELDKAEKFYRDAVSINPYFNDAVGNLSQIYLKKGDSVFQDGNLKMAEEYYRQALNIKSINIGGWMRLAILNAARGNTEQAGHYLDKIEERNPNYPPARSLRRQLRLIE